MGIHVIRKKPWSISEESIKRKFYDIKSWLIMLVGPSKRNSPKDFLNKLGISLSYTGGYNTTSFFRKRYDWNEKLHKIDKLYTELDPTSVITTDDEKYNVTVINKYKNTIDISIWSKSDDIEMRTLCQIRDMDECKTLQRGFFSKTELRRITSFVKYQGKKRDLY